MAFSAPRCCRLSPLPAPRILARSLRPQPCSPCCGPLSPAALITRVTSGCRSRRLLSGPSPPPPQQGRGSFPLPESIACGAEAQRVIVLSTAMPASCPRAGGRWRGGPSPRSPGWESVPRLSPLPTAGGCRALGGSDPPTVRSREGSGSGQQTVRRELPNRHRLGKGKGVRRTRKRGGLNPRQ